MFLIVTFLRRPLGKIKRRGAARSQATGENGEVEGYGSLDATDNQDDYGRLFLKLMRLGGHGF